MVLEKSKEIIFETCRIWQKSNIAKGVSAYYANFEEFSKRHIQDEITDYQKAIDSLKQRSEMLKKEVRKDKEKKATLEEVKNHLETSLKDLKTKKKELESLPQRIKQIKADFQDQMKDLSHVIDDITKIKGQELKSEKAGATLQKMKELVTKFNEINEVANLDEIFKGAGAEFKLENDNGQKKIKEYKKLITLLEESIGAHCFDLSEKEQIGTKKAEFLKNACAEFALAANDSKTDNFDVEYFANLLALAQGSLIISFGIQKMENYEYFLATQYFLQARELLASIKTALKLGTLVAERLALARGSASDAFNTIYLLNSYDNWKIVEASTEDQELKEIAAISTRNIEEWITKQYGFPPEEKIPEILNTMIWPKPMMPPELSSYVPKKIVKPAKAKVKAGREKDGGPEAKEKGKKRSKSRSSKKKSADQEPVIEPTSKLARASKPKASKAKSAKSRVKQEDALADARDEVSAALVDSDEESQDKIKPARISKGKAQNSPRPRKKGAKSGTDDEI